jgi:hypothetical protein
MILKRKYATAGVLGGSLIASLGMVGTAQAATPTSVCGSGYTVKDTMPVGDGPSATIYLLRDGSKACVVTFKIGTAVGDSAYLKAWVSDGWGPVVDAGYYKYYAGPVKVTSSCVNWGGTYGGFQNDKIVC